ncbi:relaxase/mobilization nuclease domain-containing protein [Aliarcobacter butzleri]|uniref:Relaxase/mobilization nuclease domain-containing protein n=1 Tax=Aliarcobacter butzleri TaxID=28197 RepID=A0AAW7Q071_9BACT|nr:TraI/MobA(P) family conjugative relaxase [Aliarcobacter butzleri]MDN5071422.1 relaxase/mobilization nuclease domain-containing protein [Aliarcobacter butzleri]
MIVKKVIFKNQTKSSFKQLAKYALDVENNNAKILVDYMLDTNNEMEKVEAYSFTNCSFENNEDNINEIINTQKLNTTSKQDKTMHLIVSFQEDEKPSIEILNAVEKELMEALGMEQHQRLSVVHSNTNNLHIHIAVNKVDPLTLKVVNPYNDVGILQEAAIKLEKKYNLKIDNHISKYEREQSKYNIHTMTLDFETWVKEKLTDKIDILFKDEKTTFDNIQELLSEYDLEFRERRKGFVISSKSDKLFCKASSIHRELSKQQLEKRFNSLELKQDLQIENSVNQDLEAKNEKITVQEEAKKFNKFEGIKSNKLWEKYQENEKRKKTALERELKYIKLRRNEFGSSISSMKFNKETIKHIKNQRMIFRTRTRELYKKYKRVSYRDYLINEAVKGNEEAILALRRKKPNLDIEENTLSSNNDRAKIFDDVDYITKEGYKVYKDNANKLIDKGNHLKISYIKKEDNKDFILNSILKSIERFGNTLNITGDEKFKKTILDTVNEYNLDVKFVDKTMESININNKIIKEENEARKVLRKAIKLKIEAIKKDDISENKMKKEIMVMEKFYKKVSSSSAAIFAGEMNKLGLSYDVIEKMDTEAVSIKVDSFIVNGENLQGLRAMNDEVKENLKDKDEELKRFEKFLHIFGNRDKITDVTLGFYENRKVDVQEYIEKYNMTLTKLDKTANAIQLLSDKNLKIIKEYSEKLEHSNKFDKVQIIKNTDEGLTNF